MADGFVGGGPRIILWIEAACLLACSVGAYAWPGQSWWMFAAFLFVPDLSMLGYAAGPGPGAIAYNAVHTVTPPLIGLCAAVVLAQPHLAGLALIWLAHIGLDRTLGYGLKYARGFGDTHLGPIGRARITAKAPR